MGLFQNFEFVTKIIYRDSVRFVVVPTGISNTEEDKTQFRVFPNPASDNFLVVCPSLVQQSLTITDLSGRKVFEKQNIEAAELINCAAWERGVYFVELSSGNSRSVRKVVLQ